MKYQDSVRDWKIDFPVWGKTFFVDKEIEYLDSLARKFHFEGIVKFSLNLYFYKFVWITFYGVATEKYATCFDNMLHGREIKPILKFQAN